MTLQERDLCVYRIVSGCIRCNIHDNKGNPVRLFLKSPSRYYRYIAEEVYKETLMEGRESGLPSDDDVVLMLIEQGLWSKEKQERLDTLPKDLEELKVRMYQLGFKSLEKKEAKRVCKAVKADIAKLQSERNLFGYSSAEGAAYLAKVRYIIGMSLYYPDGTQFFSEDTYWESSGHIVDEALEIYNQCKLTEPEYRELARTDPWRTIWSSRKIDGLFGIPSIDYTEEQRALTVWSSIYENIYSHPECPPDSILEDDDVLDGWMIIQKRKREKDTQQNKADEIVGNEKVRNSGEVFIQANTIEDAREIEKLNEGVAKINKKQRMAHLMKVGEVAEQNMPDTKLEIQMEMNRRFSEAVNARKSNR